MASTAASACKAALSEASKKWLGRRTASDGILSSLQHQLQNPNSDHDFGNAFDLTHDPAHGVDNNALSRYLQAKRDPRIKYIIWNRQIWNPAISNSWRSYQGSNPHDKHMHVSVFADRRNDTTPWWITSIKPQPAPIPAPKQQGGNVPASNKPVVAVLVHDNGGYLEIAEDGGVFAFGDVGQPINPGSLPGIGVVPNFPILNAAWSPTKRGYILLAKDGGIFSFGDAEHHGNVLWSG
jgi:hypothetical protein